MHSVHHSMLKDAISSKLHNVLTSCRNHMHNFQRRPYCRDHAYILQRNDFNVLVDDVSSRAWLDLSTVYLWDHGVCTSECFLQTSTAFAEVLRCNYRKAESGFAPRRKTLGNVRERYGSSACPTNSVTSDTLQFEHRLKDDEEWMKNGWSDDAVWMKNIVL